MKKTADINKYRREYYKNHAKKLCKQRKKWADKKKGKYLYMFLNKEGEILYVGQTTNIYMRTISHFNHFTDVKDYIQEVDSVKFTEIPIEEDLLDAERFLINTLHPRLNKKCKKPSAKHDYVFIYNWKDYGIEKYKKRARIN